MTVDWANAAVGAGAGSLLTAGFAYIAYRVERLRVERALLVELERNLSERRAFRIETLVEIRHAARRNDYKYLAGSVLSARGEIQRVRAELVGKRRVKRTLTHMILACNHYLEESERNAQRYHFLAAALRDELHVQLSEIVPKRRQALRPGDKALPVSHRS